MPVIGEIFPLPIRSRGVALSTASNWLWNTIIAVITPYMVGKAHGNLKSSVFFVWGGLCTCAFVYSYFLIPETKGVPLEEMDKLFGGASHVQGGAMMREDTDVTAEHHRPTSKGTTDHSGRHVEGSATPEEK